jgi:hypothetical protein
MTTDYSDFYKSYAWENGHIIPQIKWAMAKDLISQGIRPYVTVNLDFYQDNLKVDMYISPTDSSGEYVQNSQNSFTPSFLLGLGGIAFYNENGFKGSADLDYILRFTSYSNDYSYIDGNKAKSKTIDGINNNGSLSEMSYVYNNIIPSVSGSWSSGNVGLKAKLRVNMEFDNTTNTAMNKKVDGDLEKNGNDQIIDKFALTPRLDLGIQYKIVPNKLTLNAGGRLARTVTLTTTDTKVYGAGNEVKTAANVNKTTNFGSMTWRLYAGSMFNFTENVWVEAVTGVNNGVSVFDTSAGSNGLFNFSSIAFGLKF